MSERLRIWQLAVALLHHGDTRSLAEKLDREIGSSTERWNTLISLANENLVTATLWSALRRAGLTPMVADDAAEYLQSFHEFNSARNRAIRDQLVEYIDALHRAGIESMPLKGAAYLLTELHGDIGDRFLSDIDLLIPEDAVEEGTRILRSLGYTPASARDYSAHHHLPPQVRDEGPAALEPHTAPVPSYALSALPTADIWARATTPPNDGRYRLPSPTDAAMLVFLHSEVVDRNLALLLVPLRLLHDLHLLQLRHGNDIDWDANFASAEKIGAATRLRRFLHVLHRVSGIEPIARFRATASDGIHFALCQAAVSWPSILRWAMRAERLSERKIRVKYGATHGAASVNRYRLHEIAEMLRKARRPNE